LAQGRIRDQHHKRLFEYFLLLRIEPPTERWTAHVALTAQSSGGMSQRVDLDGRTQGTVYWIHPDPLQPFSERSNSGEHLGSEECRKLPPSRHSIVLGVNIDRCSLESI